jgi:hypothetical protein
MSTNLKSLKLLTEETTLKLNTILLVDLLENPTANKTAIVCRMWNKPQVKDGHNFAIVRSPGRDYLTNSTTESRSQSTILLETLGHLSDFHLYNTNCSLHQCRISFPVPSWPLVAAKRIVISPSDDFVADNVGSWERWA